MTPAVGARLDRTMLRVADVGATMSFYTNGFGMDVLERTEGEGGLSVRMGFAGKECGPSIEFTTFSTLFGHNLHGTGYGHVAIGVEHVPNAFGRLIAMGATTILEPCVLAQGGPRCAFVGDPDGYAVELVEVRDVRRPLEGASDAFDPNDVILGPRDGARRILHSMFRIADVDRSLGFYADGLGMTVQERVEVEAKGGVTALFMGFEHGGAGRVLELSCYHAATEPYTPGAGFGHVALTVPDLDAAIGRLERSGFAVERSERAAHVADPDGHRFRLSTPS